MLEYKRLRLFWPVFCSRYRRRGCPIFPLRWDNGWDKPRVRRHLPLGLRLFRLVKARNHSLIVLVFVSTAGADRGLRFVRLRRRLR